MGYKKPYQVRRFVYLRSLEILLHAIQNRKKFDFHVEIWSQLRPLEYIEVQLTTKYSEPYFMVQLPSRLFGEAKINRFFSAMTAVRRNFKEAEAIVQEMIIKVT